MKKDKKRKTDLSIALGEILAMRAAQKKLTKFILIGRLQVSWKN